MPTIRKVAVFGAAGNFGTPITAALVKAGFEVTIITRVESASIFPPGLPVIRTEYTVEKLTTALAGQDAVVCAVGPAGISAQVAMIDAAEAVGVKRFIVDDFGWGPGFRTLPEFQPIGVQRRVAWGHAKELADANPQFTWTGVSIGNPIDWALKRFPLMGFDVKQRSAIIYDGGIEDFTGTTLDGIGQAIVGVLNHANETKNRFVKARSIQTCQSQLLDAFQRGTGQAWKVDQSSVKDLLESGRKKHQAGISGWVLELMVYQLYTPGEARCIVASKEDSDAELLGIKEETPDDIVKKVLESVTN